MSIFKKFLLRSIKWLELFLGEYHTYVWLKCIQGFRNTIRLNPTDGLNFLLQLNPLKLTLVGANSPVQWTKLYVPNPFIIKQSIFLPCWIEPRCNKLPVPASIFLGPKLNYCKHSYMFPSNLQQRDRSGVINSLNKVNSKLF